LFNFHKETVLSHVRYHIAYAVNDDGVFMGTTQGPCILQLCMGPSYFWRGVWPHSPLFRALNVQWWSVPLALLQCLNMWFCADKTWTQEDGCTSTTAVNLCVLTISMLSV